MPAASKAKGAKGSRVDVVEADEARDVLQVLGRGAAPPADTLAKLFRLNLGPCSASCGTKGSKGTKDNPCCFHGLLPAEGGFRKKGLWQKEAVLGQLGHDPREDRRMSPAAPAGLRNLGNTCYVNAAMQFLHSLPAFRNALYKLEPELAEQQIVKQMRDLFIDMHFGPKRYVDPEPFANSLLLDHAIQQDGQEFLKLLLSKLEVVFAASQRQEVATVVQGLFQGHLSHVTTCHTCRRPSEGSKREVEFYELSLQVQGMPSLHTSLVAALAPDELVGDNQYFCDFCAAKSDADRCMRLRSLPPYLCLALQRFTYDHQTWEKKKVLHKLSIPLRLDMGQVLADAGLPLPDAAPLGPDRQPVLPGSPNSCYELVAVLIHKGTSASHGHYVAHIKLHDTGTWWRFDDEEAVDMGLQPTSHPGDHGTTAAAAAAAAASGAAPPAAAASAGGSASADAESSKPAVGKKRGRGGGGAGAAAGTKRGRGAGRGGRGGRQGKQGGAKRDPWEGDSDADAEAEAATAAAEAQADEDAQMQAAMQMSLLDAQANGDVDMSAAELQAVVESAADIAAQAGVVQSSRCRAAEADPGTSGRGRGRGRGRSKGKAAAAAAAAPGTEAEAVGAATIEAANADQQEQAGTLPQALVDQIVSANAYFLVYRHTPDSSTQQQPAAAAAAVPQAAGAAAAPKQEQQPQQPSGQRPLQARDPNVQPGQQPTGTKQEVMQQADAAQQQQQQGAAGVASEQQLPLEAQHLQAQLRELPKAVQEQVAQLHQDFEQTCARFQQRKQQALAAVQHRKEEVTSIAALLPVPEGEAQGCFISTNWLDGWVNSDADPDPVDNGVLLCEEHRQLNPLLPPGTVKYISSAAWEQLTARHRGGPRLSCADVCRPCLQRLLQGIVSNEDLVGLRERVLSALETDEAEQGVTVQEATSLYVSRTWWHGFRRRSTSTSTSRILPMLEPPTAGICCPHGRLLPEGRSTGAARRFAVSRDSWGLLRWLWATQVLSDVQARQDKAKRTAAKRTAAGGGGDDAAAVAGAAKDDCVICDTPQKDKQQQQQQDGQQPPEVQVIDDTDMDAAMTDTDRQQEQQQQQQQQGPDGAADRASSPGGAADAGEGAGGPAGPTRWRLPFPVDGSVPLSAEQLLQALPEFSVMAYDCETCSASLQEAAAGHEEVKQQLEGQKQALGKLLAGCATETLEEGVLYYLVPNGWLDTWRRYLQAALARKLVTQLPPVPEPLPEVISALMCTCHPPEQPLLAVPLPVVVNKRGRFSQADPGGDALRVVTEQDWQQLLLHYSGLEADRVEGTAVQQHTAAAGAADGPRPGRRRPGRSSEQQTQPEAGLQQEQRDMLQQRIASMADTHPGFRGIRARLRVATADVQQQQQEQQQQQGSTEVQQPAAAEGRLQTQPPAQQQQQQQQEPQANGHVTGQPPQQQQAVIMAGADAGADAVDLTSSPSQQAPRLGKRQRQAAVDADVVLVESVDLVAEGPAAPAGARDDVQVVDVDANGVQEAAAGDGGQSDRTARARSSSRSASGARAVAAAMLGRRPSRRGASAGVAAAIEAAASADSLEDVGSDSEAYAVAAAAAATAAQRGWLETEPGLCEATLQAEAAALRAATLVYADAELMVELVAEEELHAAFSTAGAGERRSRRARKNRQPVKACSTDTLAMLKLRVFEVLSVHPANQRLYVRGQLLEGDNCTLAKLEVFPDEEVRVVNANQVPDDDYASVFDGVAGGKRKAREVETGFKDTALHGSSMPAATPAATPPPADGGAGDAAQA